MKRSTVIAALAILAVILSITLVYAQGRGAGVGRNAQACPYRNTCPNPDAGGWWTKVQPTTLEQKAFVDQVTAFHNQVREKQMALAQLQAAKGDAGKIAQLESEIAALRTQFHEFMLKNQQIRLQLGVPGCGVCCAVCPMAGQCPGPNGQGCPLGMQCNMNGGAWWTQVQPKTKEQKAFVDTIAGLHNQLRDKQIALMQLRTTRGDQRKIAALEQEVVGLQTQIRDQMMKNQQICRQIGAPVCNGTGPGNCGMMGQCRMQTGMTGPGMGRRMGGGMGRGACGGMNGSCPLVK